MNVYRTVVVDTDGAEPSRRVDAVAGCPGEHVRDVVRQECADLPAVG